MVTISFSRLIPYVKTLVIVAAIMFLTVGLSRYLSSGQQNVERLSPNGLYRLDLTVDRRSVDGFRGYAEHVRYAFYRRNEIVTTYEFDHSDQLEPSFREMIPVIDWVSDNVFHAGSDPSEQPFMDELVISNNLDQSIKYMSLSYGKSESFWILDLPAKSSITLHAASGIQS